LIGKKVLLRISYPDETSGLYMKGLNPRYSNIFDIEEEVLLPRGTKLKLIEYRKKRDIAIINAILS
jgi:hypothetical protein